MVDISDSRFENLDAKRLAFREVDLMGSQVNCANLQGATCNISGLVINGVMIEDLLRKNEN